ncbi:methyltransferase domain-containing protein [Shewanella eurypsychrophilus]|uniref:Methyltransferase domain-containing protein n=1 Tax=Shewanella eurypsychrophilus TaxID=2593656 RepID=A0ABX6V845_9GAMM|nr:MULTISPECIES: class I SAM-dependent methyltransferase [Shewanella]QFU22442.1 methyltransferase domain-containing protein [Shewanella sp. YLB-09]QPG57729.1 methyltransferase domain-containing protein [Shewanella eurypsychrophilus]
MNKYQHTVSTFDKLAERYQDKYMDLSLYGDTFDTFIEQLRLIKATSLFEMACGPGNITRLLHKHLPELSIFATDLSPNMVKLAQINNPTAVIEVMDCRKIAQIDDKFNAIMSGFCLPYLSKDDAKELIEACAALLLPNGVIYLSTMEDDYEKSKYSENSEGDKVYTHYHQAEHLSKLLKESGFEILKLIHKTSPAQQGSSEKDLFIIAQLTDVTL